MRTLKTLLILILAITFFNCSNDDDINNPPVNANGCNYQGLTFEDNANNTMTLIPESDLTTDFFPNNNGPGIAAVEIFQSSGTGSMVFVTDVVTLNAAGTGTLMLNGTSYIVNVVCQIAGTTVGGEFRFDIVEPTLNIEAEFCVIIDAVIP